MSGTGAAGQGGTGREGCAADPCGEKTVQELGGYICITAIFAATAANTAASRYRTRRPPIPRRPRRRGGPRYGNSYGGPPPGGPPPSGGPGGILSGLLRQLHLEHVDTGDLLLILILILLFKDGEDEEMLIALGLLLIL